MTAMQGKRLGVVDTLHNVSVDDPYRWLEERNSVETERWIAEQSAGLDAYMQAFGPMSQLKERVNDYLDVQAIDQVGRVGDRYFFRKREVGQQQASIYVGDMRNGSERLLVDPAPLGHFTSVGIHRVAPDGRLLAFELKRGGEHSKEIHIVDVDTGDVWRDYLERGLSRGFAFRLSGDGFYYCHDALSCQPSMSSEHLIRCHIKDTDRAEDEVLFHVPREEFSKLLLYSSEDILSVVHYHQSGGVACADLHATSQLSHATWAPIMNNVPVPFTPFFHGGRLFAHRMEGDSNGKLVQYLSGAKSERIVVPEWHVPIKNFVVASDHFYVSYLVGTATVLMIWTVDGSYVGEVPLDDDFSWVLLPGHSNDTEEVILLRESFTESPSLYVYSTSTGTLTRRNARSTPAAEQLHVPHRQKYQSKDGTQIDITLLGPENARELKGRPVIMTAYGSAGVTLAPQFSVFVTILLDLGFVFAIPEIRGGGERGREWHEAARGRNKQVAVDDFIAAAEYLVQSGHTKPEQLAIFGGSFSGLLVGAAFSQRPELFRAVLCISPLLDMIRYHLFDRAAIWSSEFGTADEVEDFEALIAYSPYHQIRDGVEYPAILFVCGDLDTRCNPVHVRKTAARLQDNAARSRPIIVDYSLERGHAPTLPVAVRVEALVRRVAFICNELSVCFCGEEGA